MAQSIQDQINEQMEERTENATTDMATLPLLTDEAIRSDTRRTDIVEVNFSSQNARIVGTSDAPKLTLDVVREESAPIQPVKMVFDQQEYRVDVRMGVPFSVNARHSQLIQRFNDLPDTPENNAKRNRAVKNLYISEMIDNPKFSFDGQGEGRPIEDVSDVLADALFSAYVEKNQPEEDQIYQVTVLRGQPIHTAILLQDSFDAFPAPLQREVHDMTQADIEATTQRSRKQREILVSSMVFPEGFSFSLNGEGSEGELYPIEQVSELWLQALHAAYRASNIPEVGLSMVSRFSVASTNSNGEETAVEGVS